MQKIYLIRHGETAWNRQLRYQGRQDIPLNDVGQRQAELTAHYLRTEKFARIYSSPLLRARKTAEQIAGRHDLEVKCPQGLLEIDFGAWEGRTYTELGEKQQLIAARWFNNPESAAIPDGELYSSFNQRVMLTYRQILQESSKNMAIVTHAGVIRVIISTLMEMPARAISRLRFAPASLTLLSYDDEKNPYLEYLNVTAHLNGS